ncbi:serine/threonine-protein phosphatase 5-like [Papaver somniferum]|uniref:serine/threonine-protein phosphatase 5-like n=1 Tax=Papaver somniferum TaxID=3469 RepID=UPI000E6F721F|nr:serine/threonine-protein phosphatase 5-like [Papaver somniferum]
MTKDLPENLGVDACYSVELEKTCGQFILQGENFDYSISNEPGKTAYGHSYPLHVVELVSLHLDQQIGDGKEACADDIRLTHHELFVIINKKTTTEDAVVSIVVLLREVERRRSNDSDATKKLKGCEDEEAIAVHGSDKHPVAEFLYFHTIEEEMQYVGARKEGEVVILLQQKYGYHIVLQTRELLCTLLSLINVSIAVGKYLTVCGDQLGIFELNGLLSEDNPYLIKDDFVDRGSFSLQVIFTLFALECTLPSGIHLARGNQESKNKEQYIYIQHTLFKGVRKRDKVMSLWFLSLIAAKRQNRMIG